MTTPASLQERKSRVFLVDGTCGLVRLHGLIPERVCDRANQSAFTHCRVAAHGLELSAPQFLRGEADDVSRLLSFTQGDGLDLRDPILAGHGGGTSAAHPLGGRHVVDDHTGDEAIRERLQVRVDVVERAERDAVETIHASSEGLANPRGFTHKEQRSRFVHSFLPSPFGSSRYGLIF